MAGGWPVISVDAAAPVDVEALVGGGPRGRGHRSAQLNRLVGGVHAPVASLRWTLLTPLP